VLAIDLDHFDEINNEYFILGGDRILAEVARLLVQHAWPGALLFRDGGDQFTIVLYGADQAVATEEAERLRALIAATPFEARSNSLPSGRVTVSIGMATLRVDDAEAWQVFERARTAVHEAKARGRNCVVPDDLRHPPTRRLFERRAYATSTRSETGG
jgi:diguanylate cyclase (GGDEF)-like protein